MENRGTLQAGSATVCGEGVVKDPKDQRWPVKTTEKYFNGLSWVEIFLIPIVLGSICFLPLVAFTEFAVTVCTGSVEVAQGDGFQSMLCIEFGKVLLYAQLRFAVRIDGLFRMLFVDRRVFRFAVDGCGGGEDQLVDECFRQPAAGHIPAGKY